MADGTEVGKIYYSLTLNDDDFKKGVTDAQDSGQNLGSNLSSIGTKVGVALGAAGAGLTVLAKQSTDFTVDYVKSAKNMARVTGDSVENASRLSFAFQQMGIDSTKAAQTFGIFEKHIAANDDAFKSLDISTTNADGSAKSFNDILLQTADKFSKMPDGIQKTADVMNLFGKSGKDLLPALNLGAQGIEDLETKADKLGLTLDAQNIGSIAKYIQSQKDLKASTDSMKIAIGEATAPVLTAFNNALNGVLQNLLGTDGPMRTVTADAIAFGGPILTGVGALLAFASNLGTVITTITELGITMAGFGAFAIWALAIAGIVADLYLIVTAVHDVIGAFNALSDARAAQESYEQSKSEVHSELTNLAANGDAAQKARAQKALASGLATGGYAQAGVPHIIGEVGPELFVPNVSGNVIPNNKLNQMLNKKDQPSVTTHIGQVVLQNADAVNQFFKKLDRKQQLAGMGLTPS